MKPVYLYILVGKEYEGLPEQLHLQVFPWFVNPEGRFESITALSNPNWPQYHVYDALLLVYYSLKMSNNN